MSRRLYTAYRETRGLRDALRAWDEAIVREEPLRRHAWTSFALWPVSRSATVADSTAIEGNSLTPAQVGEVLSGGSVDGREQDVREVRNYNAALDLANQAALRPRFRWTDELLRRLNSAVMSGLPGDEGGEYRREQVTVAGAYHPPEAVELPGLMDELVAWLQEDDSHPIARSGLVHLNVAAIHPWLDGNGRTARIAGALSLTRSGVSSPELLNVERELRADRRRYFASLLESQGQVFDPENHSATPWLEYFARVCVRRLERETRILAAVPGDVGAIALALVARSEPLDWAPILLAARLSPIRTTTVASMLDRSRPQVRSILARMAGAGWLVAEGERRGRRYRAGRRLIALDLRLPDLVQDEH